MVGPQTIWVNYYNITLYKGGGKISSVQHIHRRILVNVFGEARSEARRAKVRGPKGRDREWGFCGGAAIPIPTSWVVWGSAVSSPVAGYGAGFLTF